LSREAAADEAGVLMHVLLAGDFTASLHAQLRAILFDLGVEEILDARTAEEATAALTVVDFDLILVDLRMPVPSGTKSIPELRRSGQLRTPVVVIVTYSDPVQLVRARKLGVQRCQSRSVSLEGIRAVIDAALKTRGERVASSGGMR
jgi:DNA-binding NarL/FixJ family response regulator